MISRSSRGRVFPTPPSSIRICRSGCCWHSWAGSIDDSWISALHSLLFCWVLLVRNLFTKKQKKKATVREISMVQCLKCSLSNQGFCSFYLLHKDAMDLTEGKDLCPGTQKWPEAAVRGRNVLWAGGYTGLGHRLLQSGASRAPLNCVSLTTLIQTVLRSHLHFTNSADACTSTYWRWHRPVPALPTQDMQHPHRAPHTQHLETCPLAGFGAIARLRPWAELRSQAGAVEKLGFAMSYTQDLARRKIFFFFWRSSFSLGNSSFSYKYRLKTSLLPWGTMLKHPQQKHGPSPLTTQPSVVEEKPLPFTKLQAQSYAINPNYPCSGLQVNPPHLLVAQMWPRASTYSFSAWASNSGSSGKEHLNAAHHTSHIYLIFVCFILPEQGSH